LAKLVWRVPGRVRSEEEMRRVLSVLVAVLWLSLSDAYGQVKVSAFGGGTFPSMSRTFTIDDTDDFFTTEFLSGPKVGVRVGTGFGERFSVEGTYSYGRNDLRVTEMDAPVESRERVFEMTNQQLSGNAVYHVAGTENWRPFLTAGLGLTRFNPTQEAMRLATVRFLDNSTTIRADNKWSVNFGGGAEMRLNDSLTFRADLRDYMVAIPRFGIRPTSNGSGSGFYPVQGWGHSVELSAGVAFSLR
jgi:opacity protein-like surface antigen